jgi:exopolysaccharide biosynthesis protein
MCRILLLIMASVLWVVPSYVGCCGAHASEAVTLERRTVDVDGATLNVDVVTARLDAIDVKVGLAGGRVGAVEDLDKIARGEGAIAAINGTFFEAYSRREIKSPHHTIITGGTVVHIGGIGTTIAFPSSGDLRTARVKYSIEGSINGSWRYPQRWFAYWLNRYPTADTITIFTRCWGEATGLADGIQVVVEGSAAPDGATGSVLARPDKAARSEGTLHAEVGGIVKRIATGSQRIPKDGFVIYFRNRYHILHQKFAVGDRVEYRIVRRYPPDAYWDSVDEALEAGPLLVRSGRICLNPEAEGFSSAKILSLSGARSAVGRTADGRLLLATTSGTVRQLAAVMKRLGAEDALNLDGGASSCLWYRGKYVVAPGRKISSALLLLPAKARQYTTQTSPPLPSSPPSPVVSPPLPSSPHSTIISPPSPTGPTQTMAPVTPYPSQRSFPWIYVIAGMAAVMVFGVIIAVSISWKNVRAVSEGSEPPKGHDTWNY